MTKKKQTTNGQGTLKAKSAEVATPQYEYTSNITIPGVGQSLEDERFLKVAVGEKTTLRTQLAPGARLAGISVPVEVLIFARLGSGSFCKDWPSSPVRRRFNPRFQSTHGPNQSAVIEASSRGLGYRPENSSVSAACLQ